MLKRLIILVLCSIVLSGCIPAAFVAGAGATSVIYDRRSMQQIYQDQQIDYQASMKLNADPEIKSEAHINARAFNGIVLIVGQAPTQDIKDRAVSLVQSVPNIRRIYNEIQIEAPSSMLARSNDAWITTKVKSAMLAKPGLRSGQIKVVTEDGVVYLMGLVTRAQADAATDVAAQVAGVQKVVKLFEYVS